MSTLNDDEVHFIAPWEYESTTEDAVARLCDVIQGGEYAPPVTGISSADAAAYIGAATVAVFSDPFPKERGVLPDRPKVRRAAQSSIVPFKGTILERSTTPGGSQYVKVTLFPEEGDADDQTEIIDAEFLFLRGDNIVNVRATSREQPETDGFKKGKLSVNMTGFVVDKNLARRKVDALRKALGWNIATVMVDFDPAFNAEVPTVVERIFNPFSEKNAFKPSGIPYPVD